jgi:hypothetical protein
MLSAGDALRVKDVVEVAGWIHESDYGLHLA